MTLEWVEAKQAEYNKRFEGYPDVIFNMYYELEDEVKKVINHNIEDDIKLYKALVYLKEVCPEALTDEAKRDMTWIFDKLYNVARIALSFIGDTKPVYNPVYKKAREFYGIFKEACRKYFKFLMENGCHFYRYLDSEVLVYDGEDIIITDPCYLLSDMNISEVKEEEFDSYWEDGTFNGAQSSTIYGDWSCTTWDMNTKEPFGEFCADGGMVCVVDLNGVRKLNPNFDWYETKPWTTTIIRNFKGMAQIKIKEEIMTHEEDYEGHWKKGDEYIEYVCYVEGHGVNSETGEPIDFITSQTGL